MHKLGCLIVKQKLNVPCPERKSIGLIGPITSPIHFSFKKKNYVKLPVCHPLLNVSTLGNSIKYVSGN